MHEGAREVPDLMRCTWRGGQVERARREMCNATLTVPEVRIAWPLSIFMSMFQQMIERDR
jgi:hypothetical protein